MEWYNVEEKLPEDNAGEPCAKRVLIYTKKFGYTIAFLDNGIWREDYRSIIDDEVLLWTNLPKIPEELNNKLLEEQKQLKEEEFD